MTATPAKTSRRNEPARCAHTFSNGKRCRLLAKTGAPLCPRHGVHNEGEDLAAALTSGLGEFTSAEPINQFLSRLLLLLAQDRISSRRAAVMAYTANLLLRSASVIQQQTAAARDPRNRPLRVIWNLPCPPHERDMPNEEIIGP